MMASSRRIERSTLRRGLPPVITNHPSSALRDRLDVLVEAEEVGGIVFGFERNQPRVVVTIGAPHPFLALVAEIIDIGRGRQMRLPRREDVAGPAYIALGIGRIGPH